MWGCKDSRQNHIQYAVATSAVWLAIIIQRHAKPKAQTTTNNKLYREEEKKSCNQVLDRISCCQEIKQFRVDEFDKKK